RTRRARSKSNTSRPWRRAREPFERSYAAPPANRQRVLALRDFLAARPRDAHGLVLIAELAVVVAGEPGFAAGLLADTTIPKRLRRTVAACNGMPSEGTVTHMSKEPRCERPYSPD